LPKKKVPWEKFARSVTALFTTEGADGQAFDRTLS
jgi:hypothetical protein